MESPNVVQTHGQHTHTHSNTHTHTHTLTLSLSLSLSLSHKHTHTTQKKSMQTQVHGCVCVCVCVCASVYTQCPCTSTCLLGERYAMLASPIHSGLRAGVEGCGRNTRSWPRSHPKSHKNSLFGVRSSHSKVDMHRGVLSKQTQVSTFGS